MNKELFQVIKFTTELGKERELYYYMVEDTFINGEPNQKCYGTQIVELEAGKEISSATEFVYEDVESNLALLQRLVNGVVTPETLSNIIDDIFSF